MTEAPSPHSIWLLPDPPDIADLQDDVAALAKANGAPVFTPHMTLLGDLSGMPTHTRAVLASALAGWGPIRARVKGIARTEMHFMSLFLDLEPAVDCVPLRDGIARDLGSNPPGSFRPHLSLAYGLGPLPNARIAALNMAYSGRILTFGTAVVVASAKAIPVEDWSVLASISLGGQSRTR